MREYGRAPTIEEYVDWTQMRFAPYVFKFADRMRVRFYSIHKVGPTNDNATIRRRKKKKNPIPRLTLGLLCGNNASIACLISRTKYRTVSYDTIFSSALSVGLCGDGVGWWLCLNRVFSPLVLPVVIITPRSTLLTVIIHRIRLIVHSRSRRRSVVVVYRLRVVRLGDPSPPLDEIQTHK